MERAQRPSIRFARRAIVWLAVATFVAAGCGGSSGSTVEAATASMASTAIATAKPPLAATPIPLPTPTAVPTGPTLRWTSVLSSGGSQIESLVSAAVTLGGGFVLAGSENRGQNAAVWFSPDGQTWQTIDKAPGFADGVIGMLVPIESGLLAVGTARQLDSLCGGGALGCNPVSPIRLWTSSDGRAWQELPGAAAEPFGRARLEQMVPGPSGIVAYGELVPASGTNIKPMVWTSRDGRDWSAAPQFSTAFPGDAIIDLASGPGGYAAVGSRSAGGNVSLTRRAWYSADGRAWKLASGLGSQGPIVVLPCAGGFFGVDNPGAQGAFWTSADGSKWAVQPVVVDRPGRPAYVGSGLFSDGHRIVAIGSDWYQTRGAWVSTDGRNWQSVQLAGAQPPLDTAVAGSVVWAFGPGGLIVTTAIDFGQAVPTWTVWFGTLS